jgi:hypothetical protein
MTDKHRNSKLVYTEPREPFSPARYFKVNSVAFVQGRPELDGDVQYQLDPGNIVKAFARQGEWLHLVAQPSSSPSSPSSPQVAAVGLEEHWLYTGTQRSMDLMLSPLSKGGPAASEAAWLHQRNRPGSVRRFSSPGDAYDHLDSGGGSVEGGEESAHHPVGKWDVLRAAVVGGGLHAVELSEAAASHQNPGALPTAAELEQTVAPASNPRGDARGSTASVVTGMEDWLKPMTEDDAPKGVVTLCFTDIQGSTRLWEHFGEVRMKALLDVHNGIMRKCLRSPRGYSVGVWVVTALAVGAGPPGGGRSSGGIGGRVRKT